MKLKEFTPSTTPQSPRGGANLNFTGGKATLTPAAAALLKLKQGDSVILLQDEEEPADWYIAKGKTGFKLWKKQDGKDYLCFCSIDLKREVFKSVDCKLNSFTFAIGDDPTPLNEKGKEAKLLYPIITKPAAGLKPKV